jgi:hypothetical protein
MRYFTFSQAQRGSITSRIDRFSEQECESVLGIRGLKLKGFEGPSSARRRLEKRLPKNRQQLAGG